MTDTSGDQSGYYSGHQSPEDAGSDHSRHRFLHDQNMGYVRSKVLVKVMAVHANKDNPMLPPTIDVQPLTKQTDGKGGATSHGTVYGIPVKRNQAGDCVIINDPIVGDIGEMAIHDRDISSVVSGQTEATPGSYRRFNMSDGVYYGTVGSKTAPKHFIQFQRDSQGNVTSVNWTSSAQHNINGIIIDKDGNATFPGTITAAKDITAGQGGSDQISLQQHLHGQVQPGGGETGVPVAGT